MRAPGENNISQEELAQYFDLDRTYISLLERSQRQRTITTIFKLAKALKVAASGLILKVEQLVDFIGYKFMDSSVNNK